MAAACIVCMIMQCGNPGPARLPEICLQPTVWLIGQLDKRLVCVLFCCTYTASCGCSSTMLRYAFILAALAVSGPSGLSDCSRHQAHEL